VDLAEPILNSIHGSIPERQKACLLATSGLLNFKKGRLEEGRSLYIKSIELCKRINDLNLATKASLHLALAELEAKSPEAETFARQALAMSQNSSPPDILTLREQINSNLAKRRALKK
jgi:hypothetical protein